MRKIGETWNMLKFNNMNRFGQFLFVLVVVLCYTRTSAEQTREKRFPAFKTIAAIGNRVVKDLLAGALRLHYNPPDDVIYVKLGGKTAMERDNRAIDAGVKTFDVKGRLIYGKVAGDRLIQKLPAIHGFPPRIMVYKIKETYEGGELSTKFIDPIQIKYISGRGHSLKKFLGEE